MTRHPVLTHTDSIHQRRRLLPPKEPLSAPVPATSCSVKRPSARALFAEAAGSAAADCTAVCCCGPCVTVDLIVLAVVKLPVGLCRKAIRKKALRRLERRRELLLQSKSFHDDDEDVAWAHKCPTGGEWPEKSPARVVSETEEEMWATFSGAGFWRSPSHVGQ
ncbi:hypothetical protein ACLOJK_025130 [Asimina triloba]